MCANFEANPKQNKPEVFGFRRLIKFAQEPELCLYRV